MKPKNWSVQDTERYIEDLQYELNVLNAHKEWLQARIIEDQVKLETLELEIKKQTQILIDAL